MSIFEIDPDIRKAKTLSSEFYTDERYFDISKKKIFNRVWHFLGHTDDDTHALRPKTILAGFLDEPVLVVNNDGKQTCLSNVCTHRGKILVESPCDGDLIRCGYHGRRFSLNGKCLSMPEFEGVEGFPSASDNLKRLAIAEMAGFAFASLDPVAPFDSFIYGAASGITAQPSLTLTTTREYEVNAHWALYCENYLEGFHIPFVHQALNAVVDYGTYTTETFRYSSVQTGHDKWGDVAGRYLFMFPNTMFNYYPWGMSVNVVRPVAPSRSVIEFLTYVADESLIEGSAGADLHQVELEDEAVVESVQKGIRSTFYTHGRYSPTREQGTHHFHRLIAEFMG